MARVEVDNGMYAFGQQLVEPPESWYHAAKDNDTVKKIAKERGINASDVLHANRYLWPEWEMPEQKLKMETKLFLPPRPAGRVNLHVEITDAMRKEFENAHRDHHAVVDWVKAYVPHRSDQATQQAVQQIKDEATMHLDQLSEFDPALKKGFKPY